jgi:hypothetical protein
MRPEGVLHNFSPHLFLPAFEFKKQIPINVTFTKHIFEFSTEWYSQENHSKFLTIQLERKPCFREK